MDYEKEISLRVEKIKTIFQAAKEFASIEPDLSVILKHLDTTDNEFCSIAYEGASMGIALRDLEQVGTLSDWRLFNDKAEAHAAQTHAGLGWALAQTNHPVSALLKTFSPLLRFRVLDGYGYYEGVFRQRTSIKAQNTPGVFEDWMLKAYDQGIGRSIWYSCKGDIQKVREMISTFTTDRQSSLWVGIGVACSYVGGCNRDLLKLLQIIAGTYHDELAIGTILAARSRILANSRLSDVELACQTLCKLSAKEAMLLSVKAEPATYKNVNDSYNLWLLNIQKRLPVNHDVNIIK
ncbi:MAG: DUF1702 family protein [Bacteroidota bacterium]